MPAKKTAAKRKSEAVVEDDRDSKKVKGKLMGFSKKELTFSIKAGLGTFLCKQNHVFCSNAQLVSPDFHSK